MLLPGALGALVEKDVRSAWRDPAMKATLFLGLVMPLLFAVFLAATGGRDATVAFGLAVFVGVSGFGANTFGFERRGIGLLLGFPVERWRLLVGKNLGAAVFRIPGLLAVAAATMFLAPPSHLPAALTMTLVTLTLAAGVDNYASILFPTPVPPPGGSPYGGSSSRRGLAGAVLVASLMLGSLLLAAPFLFLAWLPTRIGPLWLWLVTLPLALAGAAAVYAMLVAGAAGLFQRRETLLLERVLEEA
jgi:ABC-2 type transport system permease protein